jgi:Cu-Zn family superoxide dismutase
MNTKMSTKTSLTLAASLSLLLSACATTPAYELRAEAAMAPRSGSTVGGVVSFTQSGDSLRFEANITGLKPGEHGFHIHESGDCSAADASSAKGHYNPAGKPHGHHGGNERHAGDMVNLVADAAGNAVLQGELSQLSLVGKDSIIDRSVVIHADPDDYKSQPAGNSGKRIACGTIRPL